MRIERQIHHYGSGLNALPLISQFESDPTDYYLLRVAYGGLSGPLSNIDEGGFAAASFHSFEDTLKWDGYSGDYGPNFVGHSLGIGTVIINHPDFGWQALGGNVVATKPIVRVQARDSIRRRVFIAPISTLLTLDAGAFESITYDPSSHKVTVTITPSAQSAKDGANAPQGRLVVTQTSNTAGSVLLKPSPSLAEDAGAWILPFRSGTATATFVAF